MATVVERLSSAPVMSSTPALTWEMAASVVSGSISEIAPTVVVFPPAKPPATIISTGSGTVMAVPAAPPSWRVVSSELPEAIEHPFQQFDVGAVVPTGSGLAGRHQSLGLEVADDHHDDAEGHLEVGRDLSDRQRRAAELDDPAPLHDQAGQGLLPVAGRLDDRLVRQVARAARAPAGDGVRAHPGGEPTFPAVVGHFRSPGQCALQLRAELGREHRA